MTPVDAESSHLNRASNSGRRNACSVVADRLGLVGQKHLRFCPACQGDAPASAEPALSFQGGGFLCHRCGVLGDEIDLVVLVLGCSSDQAATWLVEGPAVTRVDTEGEGDKRLETPEPRPTVGPTGVDPLRSQIYEAFLEACRPVSSGVRQLLQRFGIEDEGIEAFGLRYYPKDGPGVLRRLSRRFGRRNLIDSGLLRERPITHDNSAFLEGLTVNAPPEPTPPEPDQLIGFFDPYLYAKVPFLVIPYRRQGHTVYLKARPLTDLARLGRMNVPLHLATTERVPCLFNVDGLPFADDVMLFRREIDAIAACSVGLPSVACSSLSHFRPDWAPLFCGKQTTLILDEGLSADPRVKGIDRMFVAAGATSPRHVYIPARTKLPDYLRQEVSQRVVEAVERPERPLGRLARPKSATLVDPTQLPSAEGEAGRFLTAIQVDPCRMIVLRLRPGVAGDQAAIGWCVWTRRHDREAWRPEPSMRIDLLPRVAQELAAALSAAAQDEPEPAGEGRAVPPPGVSEEETAVQETPPE